MAALPLTALAESTTAQTSSGDPQSLPPFYDILDDYGLSYFKEQYVLSKKGNDYYFYTLDSGSSVRGSALVDLRFQGGSSMYAYKFSFPNYYLEPDVIPSYTGSMYATDTHIEGNIIRSSYDIYNQDSGGTVFQLTPLTQTQTHLKGVITVASLKPLLSEVIALLPVLIPCMISFIAIRKGLSFTFRMLRAA